MKKITIFCLSVFAIIALAGCDNNRIRPGSICTIQTGNSFFEVAKVLVINQKEAHIMVYRGTYEERPETVDLSTLTVGTVDEMRNGLGDSHVPLFRNDFDNLKPIAVAFEKVTEEDLIAYKVWKLQNDPNNPF